MYRVLSYTLKGQSRWPSSRNLKKPSEAQQTSLTKWLPVLAVRVRLRSCAIVVDSVMITTESTGREGKIVVGMTMDHNSEPVFVTMGSPRLPRLNFLANSVFKAQQLGILFWVNKSEMGREVTITTRGYTYNIALFLHHYYNSTRNTRAVRQLFLSYSAVNTVIA